MEKTSNRLNKRVRKPRLSMRSAIDNMCKGCIYDPQGGGGTWRQQVEACTSTGCPLYPLRPKAAK